MGIKQLPTSAPVDDTINRPTSQPYTGNLSIFESEDRAKNLQIDRVMDILKITADKSVADIGAGSGWFSTRAAKRVGEGGKVFAVEKHGGVGGRGGLLTEGGARGDHLWNGTVRIVDMPLAVGLHRGVGVTFGREG